MFRRVISSGLYLVAIVVVMVALYVAIISLDVFWPFYGESVVSFPLENTSNPFLIFFVVSLRVALYASVVPVILFIIGLIRKRKRWLVFSALFFLVQNTLLLVFQVMLDYGPPLGRIAVTINLILCLVYFTLIITRKMVAEDASSDEEEDDDEEKELVEFGKLSTTFWMVIMNIASLAILFSLFFVPLYTLVLPDENRHAILINTLFASEANLDVIVGFFFLLLVFFFAVMMLMNIITAYARRDQRFLKLSTRFTKLMFICVSGFFIAGLIIKVLYTIFEAQEITIYSYIPLGFMFIVYLFNAILVGRIKEYQLEEKTRITLPLFNVEPLVFLILMTLITVGMLFLPIIRINVGSMTYTDEINMTGLDLLRDYATLSEGYRFLAFFLHVQLLVVGFGLAVAIAAYLSRSSMFHQVIKTSTFFNIFFVFLIAISAYYFRIAREINLEMLNNLINHYGAGFIIDTEQYDYEIETDAMIALIGSVSVLMIMFARRVFDREELPSLAGQIGSLGGLQAVQPEEHEASEESEESETISSPVVDLFDPCYSLTEIDLMKDDYEADLELRKAYASTDPSLKGLTQFVLDYAKNSRLHLSYTHASIAAFIAGLGASKLSILQGMSGTGKTSLPKIFSEAILGNCEIVEVESSWKDKHELLGYYNEFSLKYTPKKFTISLYKATLNKDIVTFILLDEMNLSRIEYYFSDFLSLMEHEEEHRKIKLINLKLSRQENGETIDYLALERGHTLKVPPNVWFIGTANRDESTFVISDKVYDRATTMNFMKRAPKVRDYDDPIPQQFYDYHTFNQLLTDAKAQGQFDAEQSDLIKAVERLLAPYNISFGNRILKQIEDFVNIYTECIEGENVEDEAVETILLSKVVAKLELKTIEDKEQLVMDFEKLKLFQCADFVKSLEDE